MVTPSIITTKMKPKDYKRYNELARWVWWTGLIAATLTLCESL